MDTTNKAIELLKQRLAEIEEGSATKKVEIETAYKEAVAAANKIHKESLAIAEKSKKEALVAFGNDDKEREKIGEALKALGERVPFPIKAAKAEKAGKTKYNFTVPASFAEAKTDNQKVYAAMKELGAAVTAAEILVMVNKLGGEFDDKKVSNGVHNLKDKFQVIVEAGKLGKALLYKIG